MAGRQDGTTDLKALRLSHERSAATHNGYLMLLVLVLALLATLAG
jgi:hypothetical protein